MTTLQRLVVSFDTAITSSVQRMPAFMGPIMSTASFVGLPSTVVGMSVLAIVVAWLQGKYRLVAAFGIVLAGLGTNSLIKLVIQRPRPDTTYAAAIKWKSFSLPSGHAYDAVAFYGLLAYLAYKYLPQPWGGIVAALLVVLAILIGISRVYLGAHYPTDVLVGWAFGGLVLWLIITYIL